MQRFRQHTLVALLNLLVLVGLAAPSLHTLAHVSSTEEASHQEADAMPVGPHVEAYCPTCALAGTIHATAPDAVEPQSVSYYTVVAAPSPATVVATPTIHFASRAPPVLYTLIVHA